MALYVLIAILALVVLLMLAAEGLAWAFGAPRGKLPPGHWKDLALYDDELGDDNC